jgi:uncharacterized protein (UPF0333 family)
MNHATLRAQASLEFLMVFLISLVMVMLIAGSLLVAGQNADDAKDYIKRQIAVEEESRSIEGWKNSGMAMDFEIKSSIEDGRLSVEYKDTEIEADGIFDGYPEGDDGKPV